MQIPPVGTKYRRDFQVTGEQVLDFAKISGDNNPIHVSPAQAQEFGFNRAVSHGAVLLAEISRIIGTELPGFGAFWTDLQVDFLGPVYWNDMVTIEMEIIQSSAAVNMIKEKIVVSKGDRKVLAGTCRVVCLHKLDRRVPMPNLSERKALVTGGSRGLGLAIAKQLLQEGYRVITWSRHPSDELSALQTRHPTLAPIFADLQSKSSLEGKIAELAGVNIIIHAASPLPVRKGFHQEVYRDLLPFLDIYLKSFINLLAATLPGMKKNRYGRIIAIGTSFILGMPPEGMYPYVIAKDALWSLIKNLAVEHGRYGITANMVSPGMMLTDMTADIPNAGKYAEAQSNPLRRLVEPEEVAQTVQFLCGEGATFINGANIPLTGGKA